MTNPESLVGIALNEFLLVEYIARGAMGLVYKATDTKMDRPVALKLVAKHADLAPGMAEARKRLKNEAQAAGRLSHPNIVTVHGWGETDEFLYICMEYVSGRTLSDILLERKVIDGQEAFFLFEQILQALEAAAAERIVHRDIKPTNIMVMKDNRVKVMDFGIAKLPTMHLTVTGTVLGTPYYMSPEQISGQDVDIRSDLFSLGAVLYQALTGQKPFEGENTVVLTYKIVHTDPIPPHVLNLRIPGALENICLKALVKDPTARYQTPTEMLKDLRALMGMGPLSTGRLDPDATIVVPPVAGMVLTDNERSLTPAYPDRSLDDTNSSSALTELPEALPSRAGEARAHRPGMPLKAVLVGSTLVLITAIGGIVAVRQYQKTSETPAAASKAHVAAVEPRKAVPTSTPEPAMPSPAPPPVQPKASVESLLREAKALEVSNPAEAKKRLEEAIALDSERFEPVFELAKFLDRNKDYPAAMAQYQKALSINNQDAAGYFRLASLYLSQGDHDQALKNFESCRALSPANQDEVLTSIGSIYSMKNDPSRAVDLFQQALVLNPGNETARKLRDDSLSALVSRSRELLPGKPDDARQMLETALSIDPARVEARLLLAALLEQKKDYAAAAEQYQRALTVNSRDPELYVKLASLYLHQGNYDQALANFEASLPLAPPNRDEVLTNMGIVYSKKNNPSRASSLFHEAAILNPENQTAPKLLKESLGTLVSRAREQAQTNPADARVLLEQALALDPHQEATSLDLARLLEQQHDTQAALDQYQKTLGINSKSAEAHFAMASIYMNQGDDDRALASLEACKALAPANLGEVLTNLGVIYAKKNNPFQAQSYFKEALDLNKKNEKARRLLSESINGMVAEAKELLQTNPDTAGKMLERALALDAAHFEAQFQLARLLTFKKDFDAAIVQYQKALNLNKKSPEVYFNLGYIYLAQGNYDRAIQNYEACKKLSPAYQDEVLTNLGISYYKKNDVTRAQNLFKEALKLNPNNDSAIMYLKSMGG